MNVRNSLIAAASAAVLMRECLFSAFKPKTLLNTHAWAKEHVRLDQRFTSRPGYYDVDYTPYMRGPHEWFSDPYVMEMTGCASRQVGKTTLLGNCMLFSVAEDPGPGLYVTSTTDNAQSYSEREWLPRLTLCDPVQELLADEDRDSKIKILEQSFPTCTFRLTGSNSPSNLMSRPIRYLFADEVDRWPVGNEDEAPALETAEACTLSFGRARKIVRVSTPTTPRGPIWQKFLAGSQHKYYVPCPHCSERHELKLEHLNFHRDECRDSTGAWDLDLLREKTTWKCPSCKTDVQQSYQGSMVVKGEWRQTNMKATRRHISWHISALYSPSVTWGDVAVAFIEKKDKPGGLHDFHNHYLGLPFEREASSVSITDVEKVRDASPEYLLFTPKTPKLWKAPEQLRAVLMAVDVQQDGFWWAQRGITSSKRRYLLDYGAASSWADLEDLLKRTFTNYDGSKIGVLKMLIDCGYKARRASGVYDFALAHPGMVWPVQGRSSVHGLMQPVRLHQFEHKGQLIDGLQLRDDLYKEKLYIQILKELRGSWFLPRNICAKYKRQLSDERLVVKLNERGDEEMEWVSTRNNHLGDVEKYLDAGFDILEPLIDAENTDDSEAEDQDESDESEETEAPEVAVWGQQWVLS